MVIVSILTLGTVACGSDGDTASDDGGAAATSTSVGGGGVSDPGTDPPRLPDDFTWTGRYVVPDLDVEVPFTWNGAGGNFQMTAGGEGEAIHFTNLVYEGQLYTFTSHWPQVEPTGCSHVGPFTVDEFNEGLTDAAYVGRETHHDATDRTVDHFRSVGVLELPEGIDEELEAITTLRLPLMAGDIYVDADDHGRFAKVLHFGLQNLYDPNLDEWIVIDHAEPTAGAVTLPPECVAVAPGN